MRRPETILEIEKKATSPDEQQAYDSEVFLRFY